MMKLNSFLLTTTFIASALICKMSYAAEQLNVSGNQTVSGEKHYSDNTGSYGISGNGSVIFDDNIFVENNAEGIVVTGSNSLIIDNSEEQRELTIQAQFGIHLDGSSSLEIKNMNVNISNGATGTSSYAASGTLTLTGSENGGNNFVVNFDSTNTNVATYYGISSNNFNAKNMNLMISSNNLENNTVGIDFTGIDFNGTITGGPNAMNVIDVSGNRLTSAQSSNLIGVNMKTGAEIKDTNISFSGNSVTNGKITGIVMNGNNTISGADDGADYNIAISGNNATNDDDTSQSSRVVGIEVVSAGNKIEGMNILIDNNSGINVAGSKDGGYGINLQSGSDLSIMGNDNENNRNVMSVSNNSHAGINNNGGTLNISNMNINSDGNIFYTSQEGNSVLNIANSNFEFTNSDAFVFGDTEIYNGVVTSNRINVYDNSSIRGDGALLSVLNGSDAELNVDNSLVEGYISTDTANGSHSILTLNNGSTWNALADSEVTTLTNNNSTIDLRSSDGTTFTTLKVNNYISNGGSLKMNVFIDETDPVDTDKLVIASGGSVAGSTDLYLYNTGSDSKDQTAIKVIDVESGATVGSDAFKLVGNKIDNSAYVYDFFQGTGGDSSYYIKSTGVLSDMAKTLANEPLILSNMVKTGMNSVMKRMGELREDNPRQKVGLWIRTYAKDLEVEDMIKTNFTVYGTEVGFDTKHMINRNNTLFIGAMGGYMYTNDISTKQTNGAKDGEGDGGAASVGAYATLSNSQGWFVDAVVRHFWEDLTLKSHTAGGDVLKYSPKRQMTAVSLEAGKQNYYYTNRDLTSAFIFEPKVEGMFARSTARNTSTNFGQEIEFGETTNITGKAAILLGYKTMTANKAVFEPYIQAGVIHEFDGKTDVTYNGIKYKSDMGGTSFEFGGGMNIKMNQSSALFFDVMYETGDVIEALSGNIGYRYTF